MSTDETIIRELNPVELKSMIQSEYRDRNFHQLSDQDLDPIRRFIENKIPPGSFLEAVLRNNLKEAMGRADSRNRRRVFEYVEYLYNYAPATCWGSDEKYEAWLKTGVKDD